MARTAKVAIIGGGIGGLTAAQALLRKGFEVEVYEAAPELKEIGAGVALGSNAMKALRSLDLEQPVRDVAWEGQYQYLRNWKTGKAISVTPRSNRFGASGCSVHRADLLDVLSQAMPDGGKAVRLAARCVSVEAREDGASAKFTDGSEIEADVIIGADGIHSAVRASIIGPDKPRFTGKICYRCLVPTDAIPGGLHEGVGATWLGPHGTIVVYKVRRGDLVNVVCHYDDDSWREESWIREVPKQEVLDVYKDWHESLLRLFSVSDVHYKWALHDRQPLDHWTVGRVTLLGDACHPMLPYLGQGACQAMEDGVVLARALDAMPDNLNGALKLYERTRLARANRVVLAARARGVDNHLVSPIAAFKRDTLIAIKKRFGKDPSGRSSAWIPDYDASTTALAS